MRDHLGEMAGDDERADRGPGPIDVEVSDARKRFLPGHEITIGRDEHSDVVVPGDRVSRRHAVLRSLTTGWELTDHSANGTWVDGERVVGSKTLHERHVCALGSADGPRITIRRPARAPAPSAPLVGDRRRRLVVFAGVAGAIPLLLLAIALMAWRTGGDDKEEEAAAREFDDDDEIFEELAAALAVDQPVAEPRRAEFVLPTDGVIGSGFGPRDHPILKRRRNHNGIDIGAPTGTSVWATSDGRVELAGFSDRGYGNRVLVDHGNGVTSLYAHLSVIQVVAGDTLDQGQILGAVGSTGLSTGPHLHFEIRVAGEPRDPAPILDPNRRVDPIDAPRAPVPDPNDAPSSTTTPSSTTPGTDDDPPPELVRVADLTADDVVDDVWFDGSVVRVRDDPDAGFFELADLERDLDPRRARFADIDGDGATDLLFVDRTGWTVSYDAREPLTPLGVPPLPAEHVTTAGPVRAAAVDPDGAARLIVVTADPEQRVIDDTDTDDRSDNGTTATSSTATVTTTTPTTTTDDDTTTTTDRNTTTTDRNTTTSTVVDPEPDGRTAWFVTVLTWGSGEDAWSEEELACDTPLLDFDGNGRLEVLCPAVAG